jgi:hypothetical protein
MGTKNDPGAFDCYANAKPDEPMFILLGRDCHAPTLVWLWASLRELHGEEPAKVAEARDLVFSMMNYQLKNGRKAVGLGQATLVGAMELIRTINSLAHTKSGETPVNAPTPDDLMRVMLAETHFTAEPSPRDQAEEAFVKAAKDFAAAHIAADEADLRDDKAFEGDTAQEPTDAEVSASSDLYNSTKAALVAAFRALEA